MFKKLASNQSQGGIERWWRWRVKEDMDMDMDKEDDMVIDTNLV